MPFGLQSKNGFEGVDHLSIQKALAEALKERLQCLVVCLSHSWGGLEQVAANDALDAGGLGLNVKVLCLANTPIHETLSGRKEIEVLPIHFEPRNYFDFKLEKIKIKVE